MPTLTLSRWVSRGTPIAALLALTTVSGEPWARAELVAREPLRVCADPNNLPFSNDKGEGLENRVASVLGRAMGRKLVYTWWAQRRGFFRSTLGAGLCDVVMGVPAGFERALTTAPYYRSSYTFVTRASDALDIRSFDDPRLRTLRVGVQLVGDDGVNTPPAHALTRRGIVDNVQGYSLFGDYARESPPSAIVGAVADGSIDVAIAWGPLAGYFARRHAPILHVQAVETAPGDLQTAFDIAVGVRRNDAVLRDALDAALREHASEVARIVDSFGVPRVP